MNDTGIVNIHGKQYHTVAKRVQDFRERHPAYGLLTDIAYRDGNLVAVKASIVNDDGRVIATGLAEEDRTKGQINKTSALENAETSAIGRALAAFGLGGTEYASANEVENAVHQQKELPTGPINATTQSWIEAQVATTGKPIGDFLKAMSATSTKTLTYEQMDAAKAWVRDNKKAA